MKYQEKIVTLKNGKQCILCSPCAEDAEEMIAYLHQIFGETHYLTRYPEEMEGMTTENEKVFLEHYADAEARCMKIDAVVDGRIVGSTDISVVADRMKLRHRATLGLSIIKDYWGMGIGTLLMEEALAEAKKLGFYQVELGVYADNERAIRLYEKMGFERWGLTKNAFRLKDGTMIDDISMGKVL